MIPYNQSKLQFLTLWVITLTLVLASIFGFFPIFLRTIFVFGYVIFFGSLLGFLLLPKTNKFNIVIGSITWIALHIILLSGIYWFYQINVLTITGTIIILSCTIVLFLWQQQKNFSPYKKCIHANKLKQTSTIGKTPPNYHFTNRKKLSTFLVLFPLLGTFVLLTKLATLHFTDTLSSPWTIVGIRFFIIFFVTTMLLLWTTMKAKTNKILLWISILAYSVLIMSVAFLVFQYGYGFDPFIHRATESWIAIHGFITPKVPYYIGQYMLVVAMHLSTGLSIFSIDQILVPIGTALLLPSTVFFCLQDTINSDGMNHQEQLAISDETNELTKNQDDSSGFLFSAIIALFFLPLSWAISTTPYSLALLFASLTILWIWYEWGKSTFGTRMVAIILILATISIHALIGIPLTIIYVGAWFFEKNKQRWWSVTTYILILAFLLPFVFITALHAHLTNPLSSLSIFFSIFIPQHYEWLHNAPHIWQALYIYKYLIDPIVVIIALFGTLQLKKKQLTTATFFLWSTASGIFLSGFLMATTIHLTDIISYEAGNYAARMNQFALMILLPLFVYGLTKLFAWIKKCVTWQQIIIIIGISALLVISWYFTYPTRDAVSHYTGFSVRQADIDTVNFINTLNNGQHNYIVLTNQMVGAAALRELGFVPYLTMADGSKQYLYSIPTSGRLYKYFRDMVYKRPLHKWMDEAMDYAGVKKAYFVHTNYWAPAAKIRDRAKQTANHWWTIDNGHAWVFEYDQKN